MRRLTIGETDIDAGGGLTGPVTDRLILMPIGIGGGMDPAAMEEYRRGTMIEPSVF